MRRIIFRNIGVLLLKLVKLNNTPKEIALGVGIGVFIGIIPLYGFKSLLVLIFSLFIPRTNKLAIIAGTNINILPITPFITLIGYNIGRAIFYPTYPPLNWEILKKINLYRLDDFFYPLFLGSIILGIICGVIFYFITLVFIVKLRNRGKMKYSG
ncbi:MAG: DUF2062 domain-containing protein [Candidatus Omnitrophica bacterium]|nr:DUF2062 domain-containing protein [Candidatus Omnitrophota bacterium]